MIWFHRKEQFDIINGGIKNPLLVIAWVTPDSYSRLFCLWYGGVWVRWFGKKRLCWQWGGTTKRVPDAGDSAASQTLSPQSGESTPEVNPAATQRR